MTYRVYPIGYSTPGAQERIDELLQQTKTLLIDTRLKPWSWDKQWRKEALEDRYGDKYKFAGKYLGNEGKDLGLIRFADIDTGMKGLMWYFGEGYDLILLCQCRKYDTCHVSSIVDEILQLLIVEVVRFEEPTQAPEPERIIICQRSGKGKGCTMTWTVGDRCFLNSTPAVITQAKTEKGMQLVKIKLVMDAPLLGRRLVSDHPKWIDGGLLKPRGTIIPEFGEKE